MRKQIFENLITEHEYEFDKATLYGVKLNELDKESLMAAVCYLGKFNDERTKEHIRQNEFMRCLKTS